MLFLFEAIKSLPFYGFANRKLKVNFTIPHLKTESGSIVQNDEDKTNLLNVTFHKIFQCDNGHELCLDTITSPQSFLSDLDITAEKISQAMHRVPISFLDPLIAFQLFFWKRSYILVLQVILFLYKLSFSQGTIPYQWKSTIVVPIFKKGSKYSPKNYRSIPLTCVLCRVFEYIASESLLHHFMSCNLLSPYQFGFLPGRFSCSQLLSTINHWFASFDDRKSIHVVYTDIAKAFDTVSHSKLLSVLFSLGVSGKVLSWIKCFLYDRVQCVCVNNHFPSYLPVLSGVPQGSILGPLLFVAYIDKVAKISNLHGTDNGLYLYADHAKHFNNNVDNLQSALNRLSAWLCSRQLNLAPTKCEFLHISRFSNSSDQSFQVCSHNINAVGIVKDLGIFISSNLKWSHHTHHIYSTASVCSYQFLRAFSSKNVWTLLKAFITYVRPKLEYNSPVWNPYLKKDVLLLESAQKKFTRNIFLRCNIPFDSYADRLNKLGITSLEYRRLEFDNILMFKIYHNLSDLPFDNYFEHCDKMYNLRSHDFKINSTFCANTDQYRNFFFIRIIKVWNNLLHDLVSAPNIVIFRKRLKNLNLSFIVSLTF